jgi:uncharacterized protein (TIGR02147 family)
MPNIFNYTDFRKYLNDYYLERKKETPWFSYNSFSQKIGFKNKGFIYNIIHQNKNLSTSSIIKISQAIGLSNNEAEYFENLVLFNQAGDLKEKNYYYDRLSGVQSKNKNNGKALQLHKNQYEFYSTWYHGAIRSLIDMFPFKDDYKWLAKNVFPSITIKQAKSSVELLEKLELITKNEEGYYRLANVNIKTGSEIRNLAVQNFYREGAQLAIRALDLLPADKRNISGLTLGISKKTYDAICEDIKELRAKIINRVNQDNESNSAYQLNFHLYPITNTDIKTTGDDAK